MKEPGRIGQVFSLWRYRWEPRIFTPIAVILTNHAIRSQIPVIQNKKSFDLTVKEFFMAVSVGFEPTVRLHAHNFSRVAPSAARTRYRDQDY